MPLLRLTNKQLGYAGIMPIAVSILKGVFFSPFDLMPFLLLRPSSCQTSSICLMSEAFWFCYISILINFFSGELCFYTPLCLTINMSVFPSAFPFDCLSLCYLALLPKVFSDPAAPAYTVYTCAVPVLLIWTFFLPYFSFPWRIQKSCFRPNCLVPLNLASAMYQAFLFSFLFRVKRLPLPATATKFFFPF